MAKKVIPKKQTSVNAKLWPILLLLFTLFTVVGASAQSGALFNVYDDSVQAVKIVVGPRGPAGVAGANGANGLDGLNGTIGKDGVAGANGVAGAQGAPGSNDCISGICVSRQASTPGTQETGNINIDGRILAGSAVVNGHTATGNGSAVNSYTNTYYSGSGLSVNSVSANYETAALNSSTTAYEAVTGGLTLDPSGAPSYALVNGGDFLVQVASGNSQNFSGGINGSNNGAMHNGTGTVTTAKGLQAAVLNTSSGTITNGYGLSTIGINAGSGTITNLFGISVATPVNAGTITNNYGLYLNDQSSVGSSNSYNIYSAGSTAKNYFAGTTQVQGHSAFGGVAVNGGSMALDTLTGTTAHNSTATIQETLTNMGSATSQYDGIFGLLKLNPSSAPTYVQASGFIGGIQIESGNSQNFSGLLNGLNGIITHAGTGTVSGVTGANYVIANTGGGTITDAKGLNIIPINLSGTITTYTGINIATPVNAGTITNIYGIYIRDQSGAGSTASYNLYSEGATAKNYFEGLVGIGATPNSTYKLDVNGVIRGTKFSGISGSTTWLSSDGSNTGLFVTDSANPQTGANRSFHVTAGGGEGVPAFSVTGSSAAQAVAVVKGAASQSANLQEWQNSAATVLSSIDENGYLGIGTSDPQYELHISQNATWTSSLGITHTTPGKTLHLSTTGGATSSWNLENASGLLYFYNTSLSETSLELQDNGNIGIGTNFGSAGAKLHVKEDTDTTVLRLQDSDGTCDLNPESGSLTTTCSSDERLKTNIRDAASVLSEINGLKIHDYTVIASGQNTTGLIAQEVLETNPDMVHLGEDGYYKVDSYNSWKLLKGIQELSSNTDNLNTVFTGALEETNGNLASANQLLEALGLRVDVLSDTMQEFADRLTQAEAKNTAQDDDITALKAEIQALKLQLNANTAPISGN